MQETRFTLSMLRCFQQFADIPAPSVACSAFQRAFLWYRWRDISFFFQVESKGIGVASDIKYGVIQYS